MANPEHLAILEVALDKQNVEIWNRWLSSQRVENPNFHADLSEVNLVGVTIKRIRFHGVDFHGSKIYRATLRGIDLIETNLSRSDLAGSDFSHANLSRSNLSHTNLRWANFSNAMLLDTDFRAAYLEDTNFENAILEKTVFVDVDLSTVKGLVAVRHSGPSFIDIDTLYRSQGQIPETFLRGCGVPDTMIAFAKSLVGKAIEYYSCFISYSSADELFARRLHNDLQANGVRVWFAPEDLKIGDPIKSTIDESIKLYDKLIIVLSENSINRAWVRHEVTRALEKETRSHKHVLFPIRLDNSVFDTTEQWAYEIKDRHIGDFTNWQNPIVYQGVINRLLRDLKADPTIK